MERRSAVVPLTVFILALAAYIATLAPGVVGGDPGEAQFVPPVLGIAHWTGYPLYTMAGKVWTLLIPLNSVAWRMNLLSAVASAAAAALGCVAAWRLSRSWFGGLLAALVLAAIPLVWNWAIVAGVRSVTVFFAVLILAVALEWGHAAEAKDPHAGRLLLALAVAFGLSMAHHRTTVFLIPGLAVYIAWTDAGIVRRWRQWLPALLLAVGIPLLLYLYIPIRSAMHPAYAVIEANTLRGFVSLALAPGLGSGIAEPLTLLVLPARLLATAQQFGREFTWPLLLLGVLGLAWLLVRRTKAAFLLLVPFVLLVGFTANYSMGSGDLNVVYLLPAYAIMSLCIGAGAAAVVGALDRRGRWGRPAAGLVAVLIVVYTVLALARPTWQAIGETAYAPLDSYRTNIRGRQAERLLQNSLPGLPNGAALIGDWEQLTPFWYAELVEKKVSGLDFHYPMEPGWQQALEQARQQGRPAFLTRHVDGAVGQRFLTSLGPLVAVQTAPTTTVPYAATPANALFGDELQLLAYDYLGVDEQDVKRPSVLPVELYWTVQQLLQTDYSVSVRLVGPDGSVVSSVDNVHPVLSMYPTSLWQMGEVVADYYELAVPGGIEPGQYRVEVRLYSQEGGTFRNLPVTQDGLSRDHLALPPITVR